MIQKSLLLINTVLNKSEKRSWSDLQFAFSFDSFRQSFFQSSQLQIGIRQRISVIVYITIWKNVDCQLHIKRGKSKPNFFLTQTLTKKKIANIRIFMRNILTRILCSACAHFLLFNFYFRFFCNRLFFLSISA